MERNSYSDSTLLSAFSQKCLLIDVLPFLIYLTSFLSCNVARCGTRHIVGGLKISDVIRRHLSQSLTIKVQGPSSCETQSKPTIFFHPRALCGPKVGNKVKLPIYHHIIRSLVCLTLALPPSYWTLLTCSLPLGWLKLNQSVPTK